MTREEILDKMRRYCAYQDRCHNEVRSKLLSIKVYGDELEEIMTQLIKDDLLNEERFARSYVRGKYRIKKWGRQKILSGLRQRHISDYCVRKGMEEIDEDEYRKNLTSILTQYVEKQTKQKSSFELYQKLYAFAYRKGYEAPLIKEVLQAMFS